MTNLEHKLHSSAIWMLLTRGSVKGLGLISSLILVRLLTPADFGIVAIAMSVYGFIELFGLFGFNAALIQKTNPTKNDYDATFTINFVFGVIAAFILLLLSAYLSKFFNDLRLQDVFYFLAFLFFIQGLKNIKVVDFQKNMDFRQEFKLQIVPKFISFFITLFLAWQLKNYWALIYGMLINAILNIGYSYYTLPYKPSFKISGSKKLFNFSKWLMINNFFYYLNNKSIELIVGRMISTRAAGLYSISQEMATLPVSEIGAPINKASYPAYTKAKNNFDELKKLFYKTCSMITILALPTSLGLYSVSDYFVPVVLGEKWLDSVEVIQILSIAAFITSLSTNNGYVFMAIGKPKITTIISGIRITILLILMFGIIAFDDISSPALALLYSAIINFFISFSWLKIEINISFKRLLIVLYRPIVSSLIMSAVIWLTKSLYLTSVGMRDFLLLVSLGVITYFTCIVFFWWVAGKPKSIEYDALNRLKVI